MNIRRHLILALAFVSTASIIPASAQTWPEKQPIRLLVPAGPGGPNDVLARIVAQHLQPVLKQSVVVENRAGAGGGLGARAAAGAAGDGYTLLVGNTATLAVIPAVSRNPGYDAARDFVAVAKLVDAEQSLVVSPTLPARTVAELVAYAKANPGKLNFSSGGVGNLTHLSGELFKHKTGTDIVHVPYRSDAESQTAVVAGQSHLSFSNTALAQPLIRDGKLRWLGVTSAARLPEFPDQPTVAETVPGFVVTTFFGIVAPAGTPPDVVDKLNAAINAGPTAGEMRAAMIKIGWRPAPSSPQEFTAFVAGEAQKWRTTADQANIKID